MKYFIVFAKNSPGGYDGKHFFSTIREREKFMQRAIFRCGDEIVKYILDVN